VALGVSGIITERRIILLPKKTKKYNTHEVRLTNKLATKRSMVNVKQPQLFDSPNGT